MKKQILMAVLATSMMLVGCGSAEEQATQTSEVEEQAMEEQVANASEAAEQLVEESVGENPLNAVCKSLAPSTRSPQASMAAMSELFGEETTDEWCSCAYKNVATSYTDDEIEKLNKSGILDPKRQTLTKSFQVAVADCVDQSKVEYGDGLKSAFADVLRVYAQ